MLTLQAICHALKVVKPVNEDQVGMSVTTAGRVIACCILSQANAIRFHFLVFYLSSRMPIQFGQQVVGGLGHAPWVQCQAGWCKSAVHGMVGCAFG
jgi:hypothetical protein